MFRKTISLLKRHVNIDLLFSLFLTFVAVLIAWLIVSINNKEGFHESHKSPESPESPESPKSPESPESPESPDNYYKCLCSGSIDTVKTCINKKQTLINYKNGFNENANLAELQKNIGGPVWKNNTSFGSY
jgi:hypothetical protein